MNLARTTVGIVKGEKPSVLHRQGTISGRSYCGKAIVIVSRRERPGLVACRRCIALDDARRAGLPDWY